MSIIIWLDMIMSRAKITTLTLSILLAFTAGCDTADRKGADAPAPPAAPVIENDIPVAEMAETPADDGPDAVEDTEPEVVQALDPEQSFYAEEISDELFERMKGKSFPEGCTTAREDLRYLHLLYKDINGEAHEGEMVCNASIADKLIDIFRQLYDADYPIEKMCLIDDYAGDDDASMTDNNTSCFNYRVVSDTSRLSKHALGLAVDINPLYNPYIRSKGGQTLVEPAAGEPYADRSGDFSYKIDKDDLAYKLFTQAGFTWGGSWKSVKDYQHFEMR